MGRRNVALVEASHEKSWLIETAPHDLRLPTPSVSSRKHAPNASRPHIATA
jgi:hypothetical protein